MLLGKIKGVSRDLLVGTQLMFIDNPTVVADLSERMRLPLVVSSWRQTSLKG